MVNHQTLVAERNAAIIKAAAKALGFDFCGISKAEFLETEAPRLDRWLAQNYHGKMAYMANYFDKRLDPRLLVDGAKSVVSFLYNYYPESPLPDQGIRISKYAYGEDYHTVIKDKLHELLLMIKDQVGEVNGRIFVDSAPVMDKVWAAKAGLGWLGKHTNLINKQGGSFYFIAELISDLDLMPDGPIKDFCGTCTRCIDACPTDAITEPYVVDGSRCISYLTIELKEAMADQWSGQLEGWAFGCDICQDVCPWNRFSNPHQEPRFAPNDSLKALHNSGFREFTKEVFDQVFGPRKGQSAVQRAGFHKLEDNISKAAVRSQNQTKTDYSQALKIKK
jgi:epoxyqueuosine reductase